MKVGRNTDGAFKLFEIVDKHAQKSKKKLLCFYIFFVFEEKDHVAVTVMTSSIRHLNTVGFMQSKVKKKNAAFVILFFFCFSIKCQYLINGKLLRSVADWRVISPVKS